MNTLKSVINTSDLGNQKSHSLDEISRLKVIKRSSSSLQNQKDLRCILEYVANKTGYNILYGCSTIEVKLPSSGCFPAIELICFLTHRLSEVQLLLVHSSKRHTPATLHMNAIITL